MGKYVLIAITDGDAAEEGSYPGRRIWSERFKDRRAALAAQQWLRDAGEKRNIIVEDEE